MSNVRITPEQYAEYVAKGLIPGVPAAVTAPLLDAPKEKVELVADQFRAPLAGLVGCSFVVGVRTANDSNLREWRQRSARSNVVRRAVSRVVGPNLRHLVPFAEAFHFGRIVRVHFVRLGGRALDRLSNLGTAMKAAEDALALILGADDGAANWVATCDQKPGGPYGIEITLSLDPP